MGRNKIAIQKIPNERNRQATFTKRKSGLIKKAMELSILCDCDVALIIFNSNNKLFQYSSSNMEKIIARYNQHSEQNTPLTNSDYMRVFTRGDSRRGGNGLGDYDLEDDDDDGEDDDDDDTDDTDDAGRSTRVGNKKRSSFSPPPSKRKMTLKDDPTTNIPENTAGNNVSNSANHQQATSSSVKWSAPLPRHNASPVVPASLPNPSHPSMLPPPNFPPSEMNSVQQNLEQQLSNNTTGMPGTDSLFWNGNSAARGMHYLQPYNYYIPNPYGSYLGSGMGLQGPNLFTQPVVPLPIGKDEDDKKQANSNQRSSGNNNTTLRRPQGLSITVPDSKIRGMISPLTPTLVPGGMSLLHSPGLSAPHPGLFAVPSPSPTTAPMAFNSIFNAPGLAELMGNLAAHSAPVQNPTSETKTE